MLHTPQLAESMDSGKVNCTPITANTAEDLLEHAWTQHLSRKQYNLVEEKSWFAITSSMEVCKRSAVDGNINSLKYQESLAVHYM